ncbi:hypothetical protein [Sphingopyxis sp. R3-92]|uniref:hypothetical protein n=1 Tax=Sphingopyxis sp. R3-92 TaxID=3158553 RepID=UPI003EE7D1C8
MTDPGSNFVEWGIAAAIVSVAVTISSRRIKREGMSEIAPANSRQKVICVALLVAMCGLWAIYSAGWHLFGGYEKHVALFVQLLVTLYAVRISNMLRIS